MYLVSLPQMENTDHLHKKLMFVSLLWYSSITVIHISLLISWSFHCHLALAHTVWYYNCKYACLCNIETPSKWYTAKSPSKLSRSPEVVREVCTVDQYLQNYNSYWNNSNSTRCAPVGGTQWYQKCQDWSK